MERARRAGIGFVAGALAVLIFHQGMYYILGQAGLVQNAPWRLSPLVPPLGIPWLINQMFWGGVWGVIYALLFEPMVPLPFWAAGLVFGVLFPQLLGSWLLVPVLKSQPILGGYLIHHDLTRLTSGLLLNGVAFGVGTGVIYSTLTRKT